MENYRLVENHGVISTPEFSRDEFFGPWMGVKMKIGKNFGGMVYPEISEKISESKDLIVMSRDLNGLMTDTENLKEIGEGNILTSNEWAQILYSNLVLKEDSFKIDSTNLSYLRLKSGVVLATYALLDPRKIWCLGANPLDDKRREDPGRRLFSKNSAVKNNQ